MGRINVLGFDVANLIAAGEVVDRPSSVVKELLENSIDAGATSVTVEIQRGGVAFIRISDNGCGMEPDDLPVAILRHATSKISNAADLGSIATLGFRGEALAAISSVSRIRIFSRPHDAELGAILTAEGGEVLDITETGCAAGTTIVVEDLFFNVPARRKFLKKDATEAAAVGAVVERIALSRPDIALKYISDGEVKFQTAGDGKLYSAVYSVFGKATASRCIEVNRAADGISVTGYVSEPDVIKSNRNMENFFVNGRYVKSKTAMAALEQAYRTRIPQDKFPMCVLNIEINPAAVDVNVHPAKLEIKFTNERLIFDAVYYAVINALESAVVRPELTFGGRREAAVPAPSAKKNDPWQTSPPPQKKAETPAPAKWETMNTSPADAPAETPTPRRRDSSFWIDGKEARRLLGAFVPADAKREKAEQVKIPVREREEIAEIRPAEAVKPADLSTNQPEAVASKANAEETTTIKTNAEEKSQVSIPAEAEKHEAEAKVSKIEAEVPMAEAASEPAKASPVPPAEVKKPAEAPKVSTPELDVTAEAPDYIILGEAYNCYVIVQLEDRLLFVDKHAAHERIIFDELCRRMSSSVFSGQLLLVPLTLEFLEIEADAIREYREQITALGYSFTLESVGSRVKMNVNQIPEMLNTTEATELLQTLATQLTDVGAGLEAAAEEFFSARLFQASCKAAIKGGRVYDMAHIRWICDRLFVKPKDGGSVIRTCPHGRPVAFEVKKSSIDRQFARLV